MEKIELVNNRMCNVDKYAYNEKKQELTVWYKISGMKKYTSIDATAYKLIKEKNDNNKTIGTTIKKIIKNKEQSNF